MHKICNELKCNNCLIKFNLTMISTFLNHTTSQINNKINVLISPSNNHLQSNESRTYVIRVKQITTAPLIPGFRDDYRTCVFVNDERWRTALRTASARSTSTPIYAQRAPQSTGSREYQSQSRVPRAFRERRPVECGERWALSEISDFHQTKC